jgi:hypothetical protein
MELRYWQEWGHTCWYQPSSSSSSSVGIKLVMRVCCQQKDWDQQQQQVLRVQRMVYRRQCKEG